MLVKTCQLLNRRSYQDSISTQFVGETIRCTRWIWLQHSSISKLWSLLLKLGCISPNNRLEKVLSIRKRSTSTTQSSTRTFGNSKTHLVAGSWLPTSIKNSSNVHLKLCFLVLWRESIIEWPSPTSTPRCSRWTTLMLGSSRQLHLVSRRRVKRRSRFQRPPTGLHRWEIPQLKLPSPPLWAREAYN